MRTTRISCTIFLRTIQEYLWIIIIINNVPRDCHFYPFKLSNINGFFKIPSLFDICRLNRYLLLNIDIPWYSIGILLISHWYTHNIPQWRFPVHGGTPNHPVVMDDDCQASMGHLPPPPEVLHAAVALAQCCCFFFFEFREMVGKW